MSTRVAKWWKSLFAWRLVGELGVWRYEENVATGKRRAIRIGAPFGPQHSQWLNGGSWEQRRPLPPSCGSGIRPAPPLSVVVRIEQ